MKDFLYNKSDICICLLILVIAAGLIFWRVDVIMAYPEIAAKAAVEQMQNETGSEDPSALPDNGEAQGGGSDSEGDISGQGQGSGENAAGQTGGKVDMCAIYINYGDSMATIADNCIIAGFVESREEFYDLVESKGVSSRIQCGQHIIPANATQDELIENLIKPGM